MLDLLAQYALDHDLVTEPGFAPKRVRWAIVCDEGGGFLDVLEIGDTEQKKNPGRLFERCPDLRQDEKVSKNGAKSHFLTETANVIALYDAKAIDKHKYFTDLLRRAGEAMPQLDLIARMLENKEKLEVIRTRLKVQGAKANDQVTFRLGEAYPLDSYAWHDWWRVFRRKISCAPSPPMRCLATGELAQPARVHWQIKGLADAGGRAESSLVGFDKDSFCSYGLLQSSNAAVSEKAASSYRAALNHLIENNCRQLAGAKVVYWYKNKVLSKDNPVAFLDDMEQPEDRERNAIREAKQLLESLQSGSRPDLSDNRFYSMAISGAGGRVMVRDWIEGQFEILVRNIWAWLSDLEIGEIRPFGIERIITSILPPKKPTQDYKDWIKPIGSERLALWHAAIEGNPIPYRVMSRLVLLNQSYCLSQDIYDALQRTRDVMHVRMGLMKAYHVRKQRIEGGESMTQDLKPYLNEEHPHPAYHCGRLMALMARVQREALGDVGAGVVQRYYAAASSTPALVLGRLTRTSQFHLSQIKKNKAGLAHWYENRIADVWARIENTVPGTLTLEEQSLFALGYYQQMAAKPEKASPEIKSQEGIHE